MNGGLSGWYGLLGILFVAGGLVTVLGILGAGALRLMLSEESKGNAPKSH